MKQIPKIKERSLAIQCCPMITHGLSKGKNWKYDFPTEIYTSPFNINRNGYPAIYYRGLKDGDDIYLLYGVFHRRDPVASHPFDFEGFCMKIGLGNRISLVTVSHFMFLYSKHPYFCVEIGAGGHGISAGHPTIVKEPFATKIRKEALDFIPMHGKEWDYIVRTSSAKFAPHVKWPWEWNSFDGKYLLRQFCIKKVHDKCDGMIWDRPDLVFRFMEGERRSLLSDLKEYAHTKPRL